MRRMIGCFFTNIKTPSYNRRFYDYASLRSWIDKAIDNGKAIPIYVEVEDARDYIANTSMTYFDMEVGINKTDLWESFTLGFVCLFTSTKVVDFVDISDGDFFAFITRYEVNQLNATVRFYYDVDWWDTLLLNRYELEIHGSVIRAHVNDLSIGTDANTFNVDTRYFTSEVEYQISENIKRLTSLPIFNIANLRSSGDFSPPYRQRDFCWLYMILANDSELTPKYPTESSEVQDYSESNINGGVPYNGYGYGMVVCTPYLTTQNLVVSDQGFMVSANSIHDDRIIAMYLSYCPPFDNCNIEIVGNSPTNLTEIKVYSGNGEAKKYVLNVSGIPEEKTNIRVWIPDSRVLSSDTMMNNVTTISQLAGADVYWKKSFVQSKYDDFEQYLLYGIVKSHLYPYTYYSLRTATSSTVLDNNIWSVGNQSNLPKITIYHEYVTDSYICGLGGESDDNIDSSVTTITLSSVSLFSPPFTQNWITRFNALEQGIFSNVDAWLNVGKSVASDVSAGFSAGVSKLPSNAINAGEAGRAIGSVGSAANAIRQSVSLGREIKWQNDGYYINGSVPLQATTGLIGANVPIFLLTSCSKDGFRQLNYNLHLYGYTTYLDCWDILKNHKRKAFNFIKTDSCFVVPQIALNDDIMYDIKVMFDCGVWLFSSDDFEYNVANYQEGI